jgi:hypothetical protein
MNALTIPFPLLEADGGAIRPNSATPIYNCIAWAAGVTDAWWWPDANGDAFWPGGAPREVTLAAFEAAFATLGYEPCANGDLEPNFEKVAVYALAGVPTHAARQETDGKWTSKLGRGPLVAHNTPAGVEGPRYGQVICFLRRAPRAEE